ncbi:MAG: sigma-70 family RNA polymerase sigma factor [Phycisphaerales bacterium]|nr:MAG: sigma-70 family RNA polymerase sigma factor [Phycisphaerales bacterium]
MLRTATDGDRGAINQLLTIVYEELHAIAERYLNSERPDHTLGATALIHEAYLRLVDLNAVRWKDRSHFLALAAQAARRVLIDHARAHRRLKRGGDRDRTPLSAITPASLNEGLDVLALHEALERLAEEHAIEARIVEMRFFAGMPVGEIAEVLNVSDRTVRRQWQFAKAWLYREISKGNTRAGLET